MTPSDLQESISKNVQFQHAEQMINKAIANMGNEAHVEYGSTMERKKSPPKWRQWLHRLRWLHKS